MPATLLLLEYHDGTGWHAYELPEDVCPRRMAAFHRVGWPADRLRLREGAVTIPLEIVSEPPGQLSRI